MSSPNSYSWQRLLLMKMAQLRERSVYSRSARLVIRYVSRFSLARTRHSCRACSKRDSSESVCVGEPTQTSTGARAAYCVVSYAALISHQQ